MYEQMEIQGLKLSQRENEICSVLGKGPATKSDEQQQSINQQLYWEKSKQDTLWRRHVHAFHTIWPSYILAYMQAYPLWNFCNIIFQKWGWGVEGCLEFFQKFILFGSLTRPVGFKRLHFNRPSSLWRWLLISISPVSPVIFLETETAMLSIVT